MTSLVFLFALGSPIHAASISGLVAYYPFEGNANDLSGNGNDGVEVNEVSYAQPSDPYTGPICRVDSGLRPDRISGD